MGFKEAVRSVLVDKYVTFSGRAARSEYWWFTLFIFIVYIVLFLLFARDGRNAWHGNRPDERRGLPAAGAAGHICHRYHPARDFGRRAPVP